MSHENSPGRGPIAPPSKAPDEETLAVGARLHGAVQVIGTAPAPTELPPNLQLPRMPKPLVPSEAETVDLFGASATPVGATSEAPEPPPTGGPPPQASPAVNQGSTDHGVADQQGDAEPLIVDLRSAEVGPSVTIDAPPHRSWLAARQGWVRGQDGSLEWQTVLTAADRLDGWETDIPLGMVAVDVMLFGPVTGDRVARGRDDAFADLATQAARRGGHAVISIAQQVTQLDRALLVSTMGSVVTLRSRRPQGV